MNDCRSKRGLNDSFAEFDSTEDEKKILRVPQEYVLRVKNGGSALIREQCEIECSRAVLSASSGEVSKLIFIISHISSLLLFTSFYFLTFNLLPLISCLHTTQVSLFFHSYVFVLINEI